MSKKILLVEDEEMLLNTYAEAIENAGFEVIKASDGAKGLEMLEIYQEELALIVLDIMMPVLDGLEFLRLKFENKEKYGETKVLVLTSMTSEKVIKEAFDYGTLSYLVKTEMTIEGLVKEVEKLSNL